MSSVDIFSGPANGPVELVGADGASNIRIVRVIHWPRPPIVISRISRASARLILQTPNGPQTIRLAGPAETHTFIGEGGEATDSDDDKLDDVQTELVRLSLRGSHPTLGSVELRLREGYSSTGTLEETENQVSGRLDIPPFAPKGTADSFFDVWFEIEITPPSGVVQTSSASQKGTVLHTSVPLQMRATVSSQTPLKDADHDFSAEEPVPLLDENEQESDYSMDDVSVLEDETRVMLPFITR